MLKIKNYEHKCGHGGQSSSSLHKALELIGLEKVDFYMIKLSGHFKESNHERYW